MQQRICWIFAKKKKKDYIYFAYSLVINVTQCNHMSVI